MIKIFEDEEDQPKNSGTKAVAPFSLNLDPVAERRPDEAPIEIATPQEPIREEIAPVDTPVEENTPVAASPWEKIEEPPVFTAPKPFEEPEIVSAPDASAVGPELSVPAEEPAAFIEDAPAEPKVFVKAPYQPDSPDETIRNSGLAWSAGIIFFGSVIFMMFLGWGFDLLFGSSPYGLVGGIVFGSLIGFIQFFRISSQIFRK